ncbi:uncharacterized protein LOC112349051 [Selaginella moellendorffii]|uniref:uncharacterized protein LOC112349051 n=1 Tax=Selaginella moellendorffii TaxID=88036 RepID=UPI000D1C6B69|nr:uncharacterized protein LOC112349051 [Selaginella moellendorffii]|eukprot:XP_024538438.1 uncharacterized protein LOC112349051 [Selaginella moellendorffii]
MPASLTSCATPALAACPRDGAKYSLVLSRPSSQTPGDLPSSLRFDVESEPPRHRWRFCGDDPAERSSLDTPQSVADNSKSSPIEAPEAAFPREILRGRQIPRLEDEDANAAGATRSVGRGERIGGPAGRRKEQEP